MKHALLWLALLCLCTPGSARAQEAPTPPPDHGIQLEPITELPASYPRDVPLPQGAKPVAATERDGSVVVLFIGVGKAEPMRAAYEAALAKRGWSIEGSDKVGEEQGLFCVQGERTLSIFFREKGPELRIQMAHVPKTPPTPPPAKK